MSCVTILFLNLKITRSDIRPYIKWLSVWWLHMVTLIFLRVCVGMYGLTYSLYHPRGIDLRAMTNIWGCYGWKAAFLTVFGLWHFSIYSNQTFNFDCINVNWICSVLDSYYICGTHWRHDITEILMVYEQLGKPICEKNLTIYLSTSLWKLLLQNPYLYWCEGGCRSLCEVLQYKILAHIDTKWDLQRNNTTRQLVTII